jgi:class 3 adenylate cyclase/tetratricopeptide (TPR) repeat protein
MTEQNAHSGVQHGGARRRYLTLMFSDLCGSSQLAAAMEAEDYAELLAHLRSAYETIIAKHGGTIVQHLGDGVMAAFGYPEAREDDGRRAAEAATDLHEWTKSQASALAIPHVRRIRLHTGIHSGLVLAEGGDALSGSVKLVGNPVNIAARLAAAAQSDDILVSRETLGADKHFFRIDAERLMALNGIPEPVAVYRIFGRSGVKTRFEARTERGLTPFVGRQTELGVLYAELDKALRGEARCTVIAGGPGVGKTRLVEQFLGRAARRDWRILRAYCESYLSAEPLQPFRQVLRSIFDLTYDMSAQEARDAIDNRLAELDPALAHHRGALLRILSYNLAESERQLLPDQAALSVIEVLKCYAAQQPAVLFIDDWQWADDATRHVFAGVRAIIDRPIFALLAARDGSPEELGFVHAQVITLDPLTSEDTDETIGRLLPGRTAFVQERIKTYSGGNPLFLEELCHLAATRDELDYSGAALRGEAWLEKLIEARVERLPAPQAELVRVAAVIGNVIPFQLLEAITGYPSSHPLLRALAEQDMLYLGEQAETFRFKHGIAKDVIYNAVGLRERRALHAKIAKALQERAASAEAELYEPLAYHYGAAGAVEEAARYAELAGDKAMAASALDRAQVQYRAALSAVDQLDPCEENTRRWMSISQRMAFACVFDPSREQLAVLLTAAERARALGDPLEIAKAEYWVGYIFYALGEYAKAVAHMETAEGYAAQSNDPPLLTQIRATLGQAYAAACEYEKALEFLSSAIDVKRRFRKDTRPAVSLAYTLACKAAVLGDRGQFKDAHDILEEALSAVRGANHEVEGSVLAWRSAVFLWQGRWEDALISAQDAKQVGERVKSFYIFSMSVCIAAFAGWKKDRDPERLKSLKDSATWLENRKRGLFTSLNFGWLAESSADVESWPEVRRYWARAVARSRALDRLGEAMAHRAMARAAAAGRIRKPPDIYLRYARRNADQRQSPREAALNKLCDAEIRLHGQDSTAGALLDDAEAAFHEMGMSWHAAECERLRLPNPEF